MAALPELTPEFRQPFAMLADVATVGAQKMAAGLLTSSHHQEELPVTDFLRTGSLFFVDDRTIEFWKPRKGYIESIVRLCAAFSCLGALFVMLFLFPISGT